MIVAMAWIYLLPLGILGLLLACFLSCLIMYARHPEKRSMIQLTKSPTAIAFGSLMALIASCLLLYQSIADASALYRLHREAERAQGVIVGFRNKKALVRFETRSGVVRQFKASFADARPVYDKGMRVDVLYLPEDPAIADIDDFYHGLAPVLAQLMGGLLFTCIGVLLIASWKWKRQERGESDRDPFQGAPPVLPHGHV